MAHRDRGEVVSRERYATFWDAGEAQSAVSWRPSLLAAIAEFELDAAEDGSSSATDGMGVRVIGGTAIKQPEADGDPMINAEPSRS